MLPNFLGIGAQKSGTTWLHKMLKQHPEIFLPSKKELMFFDNESNFNKIGIEGYEKYFQGSNNYSAVGEITPGYLWSSGSCLNQYKINPFREKIPERIRFFLGNNVKLIVILRNPVDRAISAYFHHLNKGRIKINDNILKETLGIIHMGFYNEHLNHWSNYFNLENFLILTYEWLFEDQSRISTIFRFLRVDDSFMPIQLKKVIHQGLPYYRQENGEIWINQNVLPNSLTSEQNQQNNQLIKVINKNQIEALEKIYNDDMKKLEQNFNVDITYWKKKSKLK